MLYHQGLSQAFIRLFVYYLFVCLQAGSQYVAQAALQLTLLPKQSSIL